MTELNEQISQSQPARQYDVPVADVYLDVDEAATAIKKLHSDIAADKNHPYMNRAHPLHKDYVDYASKLHETKTAEDSVVETNAESEVLVNQVSPDVAKAMQKALNEKASNTEEIQEKLVSEFQTEAAKLESLGFDSTEMPDKILPYQVRGLKEQRLFTEATEKENTASWEEFKIMIRQDFTEMKNTPYAPNPQTLEILDRFLGEADASYLPTQRLAEALFRVIFEMRTPLKKTEDLD